MPPAAAVDDSPPIEPPPCLHPVKIPDRIGKPVPGTIQHAPIERKGTIPFLSLPGDDAPGGEAACKIVKRQVAGGMTGAGRGRLAGETPADDGIDRHGRYRRASVAFRKEMP